MQAAKQAAPSGRAHHNHTICQHHSPEQLAVPVLPANIRALQAVIYLVPVVPMPHGSFDKQVPAGLGPSFYMVAVREVSSGQALPDWKGLQHLKGHPRLSSWSGCARVRWTRLYGLDGLRYTLLIESVFCLGLQ